jgi:hypothetical protein
MGHQPSSAHAIYSLVYLASLCPEAYREASVAAGVSLALMSGDSPVVLLGALSFR